MRLVENAGLFFYCHWHCGCGCCWLWTWGGGRVGGGGGGAVEVVVIVVSAAVVVVAVALFAARRERCHNLRTCARAACLREIIMTGDSGGVRWSIGV